ncbi:hypothetical protein ABZ816_09250 [Actinosynnema sp. NPDC047251]|nr:hypothetical protein [Saccharothrix espanaensis]
MGRPIAIGGPDNAAGPPPPAKCPVGSGGDRVPVALARLEIAAR